MYLTIVNSMERYFFPGTGSPNSLALLGQVPLQSVAHHFFYFLFFFSILEIRSKESNIEEIHCYYSYYQIWRGGYLI